MTQTDQAVATFAGGCFWCVEASFEALEGIASVVSGYCGGTTEDPTYEEVCSESTGHAEAVQVTYDPAVISYQDLLRAFFTVHDPTTLNRQGPDVGSQYRSAIFTHDDDQYEAANAYIQGLEEAGAYEDPIVTEVEPLETFYEAEEYHQDFFQKNPTQAYCRMHIPPKLEKLEQEFGERTTAILDETAD
ncbi:MAG: peptide-methionine (S)-S-oxide reductase MsrA [Halobacteriales archaeon]|nr:peptide-methionine (S)-S-oxide reductase MsrA [Halobacteriales archaeon]